MFIRSPGDVSLLEIIEAIDGPLTSKLPARTGMPRESHDRFQEAITSVTMGLREQLEAIKLAQLLPAEAVSNSLSRSA